MLDKLITCCVPKNNQSLVQELIRNEEFHYVEPRHKSEFIDRLWDIGQAIRNSQYIEIKYQGIQGSTVKMTYLEDGHCSISNNLSENSIRPVTVGRRNWLFCDSTDGADASMMVYSLLETARANGLNPQKYLEYLLEARPDKNMPDEELEDMAPWGPKVQECCANKS